MYIYKFTTQSLYHPSKKPLLAEKKMILHCGPLRGKKFKLEYLGIILVDFETALDVKQGPKLGFLGLLIKKPEIKKIS